ncbi:hypothetical protein DRP53_02245 [candidate division WOR-3 bacterium]|uniref:Chemotaxis protein CheA n=1 Tax=candidate division WOR-3 bacterium TaxID=2052148 RepID=A0A660SMS9_UNCW3|nr:MAG: hypothetical protein DRP53_02245 [candidate division WOR-3 bacterium]
MSEEYRDIFLTEFAELIDRFEKALIQLEIGNRDSLRELYRVLHTIKGSAGVMGYLPIGDRAHQTEEIVKSLQEEKIQLDHQSIGALYRALEFFKASLSSLRKHEPVPTGRILALRIELEETPFVAARAAVVIATAQKLGSLIRAKPNEEEIATGWSGSQVEMEIETHRPEKEIIDRLLSIPEVISITPYEPGISIPEVRISVESLDRLLGLVSELSRNITALEDRIGPDPELIDLADTIATDLLRLREEILSIRLIPLSTLFRQFPNWFRSEAIKLNKRAELTIEGGEIEVDRALFEYLREPIIHILRNALVHGIESGRKRKGPGKVHLAARKEGDNLIISISDDGRGIDVKKVKRQAVALGIIDKRRAEVIGEDHALLLLTDPRFTTLKEATHLGGRGVGLDIVRRKVEEIGGRLQIRSKPKKGSTFILTIPLSLAIVKSMISKVGSLRFAIPLSSMKDTMKVTPDQILSLLGQRYLSYENRPIPLLNLVEFFGEDGNGEPEHAVVVEVDNRNYAFLINELSRPIDLLVRPLPKWLGPYIGASIHPDSKPILHLDLRRIIESVAQ